MQNVEQGMSNVEGLPLPSSRPSKDLRLSGTFSFFLQHSLFLIRPSNSPCPSVLIRVLRSVVGPGEGLGGRVERDLCGAPGAAEGIREPVGGDRRMAVQGGVDDAAQDAPPLAVDDAYFGDAPLHAGVEVVGDQVFDVPRTEGEGTPVRAISFPLAGSTFGGALLAMVK